VARKCADVGASTVGVRGWEVRDGGLTGGVCGAEREDERVREGISVDRPAPQSSERERGREGARVRDRLTGERARADARLGLDQIGFSPFPGISNAFLFYFP
jgi:hypothetical protein